MSQAIVLYLHVHQPFRLRHYTIFDSGVNHNYFDTPNDDEYANERVLLKVAEKSYIPANQQLLKILNDYPDFKLNLSLTGVVIEQMQRWAPAALKSFKDLVDTGRTEILAETYHHSLAFFYSKAEFERQVELHQRIIEDVFKQRPRVFRNTELAYNNKLAKWADQAGYIGILAEGWDPILGWRSPNYMYRPVQTSHISLMLKNYRLSDDIAFRFGDSNWSEYPLTADKFTHWLAQDPSASLINLFMDYETFGEHQWRESGIFKFLEHLPKEWYKNSEHRFMSVSEAINAYEPVDQVDVPQTLTWADTERDLSAWTGNAMQVNALQSVYKLEEEIIASQDPALIEDWRKLQTSDHFYYMCTKWFNDGDIHAYFSPYKTPYEAYINYMNAYRDLQARLADKGVVV